MSAVQTKQWAGDRGVLIESPLGPALCCKSAILQSSRPFRLAVRNEGFGRGGALVSLDRLFGLALKGLGWARCHASNIDKHLNSISRCEFDKYCQTGKPRNVAKLQTWQDWQRSNPTKQPLGHPTRDTKTDSQSNSSGTPRGSPRRSPGGSHWGGPLGINRRIPVADLPAGCPK